MTRMGSESACTDSCIRLASGTLIDLAAPDHALICVADIAQSLAHTVRFSGHCPLQPTVAQHSLAVEHIASGLWFADISGSKPVPTALRRAALMHDAAEALVGDLAGPAKRWMRQQSAYRSRGFDELESRAEEAIAERFGIDFGVYHATVHEADVMTCQFEAAYAGWSDTRPPTWVLNNERVWLCYGFIGRVRLSPNNGERAFLRRAAQLGLS